MIWDYGTSSYFFFSFSISPIFLSFSSFPSLPLRLTPFVFFPVFYFSSFWCFCCWFLLFACVKYLSPNLRLPPSLVPPRRSID
ncbi:hypothetical protein GGS24DRAFT_450733, partial [Hypoxylon argillaceum]